MKKKVLLITLVLALVLLSACQPADQPAGAATGTATVPAAEPEETATSEVAPTPTEEAVAEPTEEVVEEPTTEATEEATPETVSDTYCTAVGRPALIIYDGQNYAIMNPGSGEFCPLALPETVAGNAQFAGDALYFYDLSGGNMAVARLNEDRSIETLDFTSVTAAEQTLLGFVLADDGSRVAWGVANAFSADEPAYQSELWVADLGGGEPTMLLSHESEPFQEAPVPIRFSDDGATLFYALQPLGIGGAWTAFSGRYDSLYSIPTAGGEATLHFECPESQILCIGDFYLVQNQLANVLYTDTADSAIVVLNGAGEEINRLPVEGDFFGYPTFGPSAEMIFYTADLGSNEDLNPEMGRLFRVAPPTAPAEVVLEDPGLLTPTDLWLDDTHLVVGYVDENGNWGMAIAGLDGTLVPLPGVTQVLAVLR